MLEADLLSRSGRGRGVFKRGISPRRRPDTFAEGRVGSFFAGLEQGFIPLGERGAAVAVVEFEDADLLARAHSKPMVTWRFSNLLQVPQLRLSSTMIELGPLHQLPLKEKLLVMEALWNDLCQSDEAVEVPQWHKDILDEREKMIAEGEVKFTDWEDAKKEILVAVK